ncbi:MAG: DUF3667 domain-containing protein [Bacteroidetes bacterium]|nr:DUF3667 domain-containing protein [Bacteroidota bacterium]
MNFFKRLFKTMGLLFSSPGFLPAEYKRGGRAGYLNPWWLFLSTVILFFILFYIGFRSQNIYLSNTDSKGLVKSGTLAILKESYKNAKTREDSFEIQRVIRKLEASRERDKENKEALDIFNSSDTIYKTVAAYDSMQGLLPAVKRDDWFERREKLAGIIVRERYNNDATLLSRDLSNKFIHYFPYLVFALLPLNALFFALLYIRQKKFTYRDHGIFLIYVYELLFILMLLYLGVLALREYTTIGRLVLSVIAILVFGLIYTIRAMKKFYEQSWAKTIFKFILFNLLCTTALMAAFLLCFGISISWL